MDRISSLEKEIAEIRKTLCQKENELNLVKKQWIFNPQTTIQESNGDAAILNSTGTQSDRLPRWAIERYSRQILLPSIGADGQAKLCRGRVLIVGAGGLGCPAATYLAGAGIGEIGIVDYDSVEITNIHRQPLHRECDHDVSKAESAVQSLREINSNIKLTPYNVQLDSHNALDIVSKYDVVLDCTDNVPTRYLLNDACVLAKVPLISGSALKMEGQITIYGYRSYRNPNENEGMYVGPCYRCVFPSPPPPDTVGSCSAQGVAGPVPGIMGALQALEAIKLIAGHTRDKLLVERMVLFDGESVVFKTVKLRPRNPNCAICSDVPTITKLLDYEQYCKAQAKEKDLNLEILPPELRITAVELANKLEEDSKNQKQRHLLVDVRSEPEFNMCRIDGSVNYAIDSLRKERLEQLLKEIRECTSQVIFICRRGNDSQLAASRVLTALEGAQEHQHKDKLRDVKGGLHAWASCVDPQFPVY